MPRAQTMTSARSEFSLKPKKMHLIGNGYDKIYPFMLESTNTTRTAKGELEHHMTIAINRNNLAVQPRYVVGDNNVALMLRGNELMCRAQHDKAKGIERASSVYYALTDETMIVKLVFRVDSSRRITYRFANIFVISNSTDPFSEITCTRMNLYPGYQDNIAGMILNQLRARGIINV